MTILRMKSPTRLGVFGPGLVALALIVGGPASAEPVFSPAATATCVYEAYSTSPGLSGHGVLDCVGRATLACHMQETARQALKLEGWWGQ